MTHEFESLADEGVTSVVHETVSTPVYTTTESPTYVTAPTYSTVPLTEYPTGYTQPVATHYAAAPAYQNYTNYDAYGSHHHYHHTDGLALASLIAGIAGLTVLPVFGSIVAIILGILALHRIRATGENGHGMAIAGLVLGALGLIFGLLLAGWLATMLGHTTGTTLMYPYGTTVVR